MELSTILSVASILLTAASLAGMIWLGGFRFSSLIHEVKSLESNVKSLERRFDRMELRFDKLENKLESLQTEFHKHDIRITTLEQRR